MRRPFVAGNWKMNKTAGQAESFVKEILPGMAAIKDVEKVICPPYLTLGSVSALLAGTDVGLGAQNMFWEASGAYTGEVSGEMVKEYCQYVIIGHSERRTYFGETDESVNKCTKAALASQLVAIVCVGETLAEREEGKTAEVVARQVRLGLKDLSPDLAGRIVIAYEPVWAIGTGRASSGADANAVVADVIRPSLQKVFNDSIAQQTRVLYGGSVTAANAKEFFGQPDIDGALVGGASLKAEFVQIIQAAKK